MNQSVPYEFRYLRWHSCITLQFVGWCQWICWLSGSDEFIPLWFRPLNIFISEIVVLLVECDMEQSWTRCLNVHVVETELWSVDIIPCKHFRFCTLNVLNIEIVRTISGLWSHVLDSHAEYVLLFIQWVIRY